MQVEAMKNCIKINMNNKPNLQLVFDANILVDALLSRGDHYQHTVNLLECVEKKQLEGWIASHTLVTLYSLVEGILHSENHHSRQESKRMTSEFIREIMSFLKVLPQCGNDIISAFDEFELSYEDYLITKLAKDYLPNPLIISRNKKFEGQDLNIKHPADITDEFLIALNECNINFVNLRQQQRQAFPSIEKNIKRILTHCNFIQGNEVNQLEQKLAQFVGVKHCIGVSSGTDALLIAMMALGIKSGDEVITTPFTFIATGEMIALLGAKPVFVDIDPKTYNIDPFKIEQVITKKTKAILPVSLYGQCADLDKINIIAEKYKIPVIEDGAQSFGAIYKGKKSCSLTTIACTSFFPSKPLGAYGDGGACFTDNDKLAKLMREIRVHGQDKRYHHPRIGVNGRLDTLQAAILLAKLDIFPEEVKKRQVIANIYSQLITKNCPHIIPPYIKDESSSVYAQYTIQVKNRDKIIQKLKEANIPSAVHYPVPLNHQPALKTEDFDLSNAEELSDKVISLPMHPYLTEFEQQYIVNILK